MTVSKTILHDVNTSTRGEMIESLNKGICEVTFRSKDGSLSTSYVTLRKMHLEDHKKHDWVDHEHDSRILVVWDMNGEGWKGGSWIQVPVDRITHFEQLTGVPK
jgi:hypothetical protein